MKNKVKFIQRKDSNGVETVDQFDVNTIEERKEAKRCLSEYRLSDPYANYYLSQRPCKEWLSN